MPIKFTKERFLFQGLRKLWRMWPPRSECMRNARVAPATHRCSKCQKDYPFRVGERNLVVDHIKPVVDPEKGFVDWNTYIDGLFCTIDNLQVLCKPCHQLKSNAENTIRRKRGK